MSMTLSRRQNGIKDIALQSAKDGAAWLRDYITAIKHGRLHPYTPTERKTREATRNEAWGPTGTILNELAEISFDSAECEIIFAVIELRLGYPSVKWRNVYKALMLLDFLLTRGSSQCVRITKSELGKQLEELQSFEYISQEGKDQGVNVRHRAQALRALLSDERHLQQERQAFQAKRKVYSGYAREDLDGADGDRDYDRADKESPGMGPIRRAASDGADSAAPSYSARADDWLGSGGANRAAAPAPNSNNRRAGEMKGVTLADNVRHLAALKVLLGREENKNCADCVGGGGASRSSWASINNGVFICMTCAGIHRGLGVHVSVVRSTSLDTWLPEQVRFMAQTGNRQANAFFEARLNPADKPDQNDGDALRAFIYRKYVDREWAATDMSWPPVVRPYAVPGREAAPPSAAPQPQPSREASQGPSQPGPSRVPPTVNIWETVKPEGRFDGGFTPRTFEATAPSPGFTPSSARQGGNLMDGFGDSAGFGSDAFMDQPAVSHAATWNGQRRLPPVRTTLPGAPPPLVSPPARQQPAPAPNLMDFDDSPPAPPTPETSQGSHELSPHLVAAFQQQAQPGLAPPPQRAVQRDAFQPAGALGAAHSSSVSELLSLGHNLMDGDLFAAPSQSLPAAMPAYPAFEAPQASGMPSAGFSDIAQARAAAFGGFSEIYTSMPQYGGASRPPPRAPPPTTVLQPRVLSFVDDGPSEFFSPASSAALISGTSGDVDSIAPTPTARRASSHAGSVAGDDPYGLNLLNFDIPLSPVAPPQPPAVAATPWTMGPPGVQNPYGGMTGAWPTGAGRAERPGYAPQFSPAPETGAYYARNAAPSGYQPTPYTGVHSAWGAAQPLASQAGPTPAQQRGLTLTSASGGRPRESPTKVDLEGLMAQQLDILKLSSARDQRPTARRLVSMKEQRGPDGTMYAATPAVQAGFDV